MKRSVPESSAIKLASGKWRLRHSAWLLAVIAGLGFFSFIGFVYCAIRVRTRKWWIIALVSGVLTAVGMLLMEYPQNAAGKSNAAGASFVIILWFVSMIAGFAFNRDYLRWRSTVTRQDAWYTQPVQDGLSPAPVSRSSGTRSPMAGPGTGFLGVESEEYYEPGTLISNRKTARSITEHALGSSGVAHPNVDVNSASASEMAAAFELDNALAERIVAVREERGGYRDFGDFVIAAQIQPHVVVGIQSRAVFGELPGASPRIASDNPGGRILDY